MGDVVALALTLAFFGSAVLYVGLCDRIIRPSKDEETR